LFEEHGKSSPINSAQYAKLYPQTGNRIVTIDSVTSFHPLYYRATLCYRSAVCVSVCPSVASRYCIEITGRIEMVFWRGYFLPSIPHCALRKFRYISPKQRYFPLGLCPKLWTSNILPRQLDHIVRKTGRRSSLLNSLTTVASLCRLDDRYYTLIAHIAGLSSRMVSAPDCGVRGPRFESRRWQLCLSRQLLRYTVCAPFLQCLGRLSLPPFVGR